MMTEKTTEERLAQLEGTVTSFERLLEAHTLNFIHSPHPGRKSPAPMRDRTYVVQAVVTEVEEEVKDKSGKKRTRKVRVTKPESVAVIAKALLGNAGRGREIVSLNPNLRGDPSNVFVGQELVIPAK